MIEEEKDAVRPGGVSVIVPTLNEAENIDPLLGAILAQAHEAVLELQVIVVDDGSTDGTRERVRAWEKDHPVMLIAREGERGLASAVLAGAAAASGEVLVVMDADLSHPPEKIAELARPVLAGTRDMVIGSRHVAGGGAPGWPLWRRIISRAAVALAWVLVDVRDPLSGFFAVRRERLLASGKGATGFKIGLEVLVRGREGLRVDEVPIAFRDRTRGRSKLGVLVMLAYLAQLAALAGGAASLGSAGRFALVGLSGLATDFIVFQSLFSLGLGLGPAHIASFAAASVVNYLLNMQWAFARGFPRRTPLSLAGYGSFVAVALMALFLRGGVLTLFTQNLAWPPQAAILMGVLSAALVNYLGCAFFVFSPPERAPSRSIRLRVAAVGVVAYLFLLRLIYLGQVDLIPEEAYYWNYSQHLDTGYLDHPPMVAWVVRAGTALFGQTEFAVRIGAVASWSLALLFTFLLSRGLFGKSAAFAAALLLAVLPFFFAAGGLMMPDSPLVAFWAGTLYFLERAVLGERRWGWWGAGACLGLGLLSKYPAALLGASAIAFLLLDRRSRRWLLAPEPYAAALLAILLFLPVILWNAEHGWMSFLLHGETRWRHMPHFSLHELLGAVLLLITPAGIMGFIQWALRGWVVGAPAEDRSPAERKRARLFILVFTLVPLAVFAYQSLRHPSKLNWTGPIWLAAVPAMAAGLAGSGAVSAGRADAVLNRAWRYTILILMLLYGAGLHFPVLGLPGIRPPENYYGMSWRELGRRVEEVELEVIARTGEEPLIVGMDKYHISSVAAFYDPNLDGAGETAGTHLFSRQSLMYQHWFPKKLQEGKSLVLVSSDPAELDSDQVRSHVDRLEPLREIRVERQGALVGRYYCRVAHGYRSTPVLAATAAEREK